MGAQPGSSAADDSFSFLGSNLSLFRNLNEKNEVLFTMMKNGIITRNEYDKFKTFDKTTFAIELLRFVIDNKSKVPELIQVMENHNNNEMAEVLKSTSSVDSDDDSSGGNKSTGTTNPGKIMEDHTPESITLALSKLDNKTLTRIEIQNVNIKQGSAIAKVYTPNLQHLTIHLTCDGLDVAGLALDYFKNFRTLLDPFTNAGEVDRLVPIDKPIMELKSAKVTLNSLILIEINQNYLVMSGLNNELAQKCLDKAGKHKETIAILGCGTSLKLPRNLTRLTTIFCRLTQLENPDVLKRCKLRQYLYNDVNSELSTLGFLVWKPEN